MTPADQIENWVKGKSIHNIEKEECTPDFSCCTPALLAPLEVRVKFQKEFKNGNQAEIDKMLVMFLGRMLKDAGYKTTSLPREKEKK